MVRQPGCRASGRCVTSSLCAHLAGHVVAAAVLLHRLGCGAGRGGAGRGGRADEAGATGRRLGSAEAPAPAAAGAGGQGQPAGPGHQGAAAAALTALGAGLGVDHHPVLGLAVAADLLVPQLPHVAGAGRVRRAAALEAEGGAAGALGLQVWVALHLRRGRDGVRGRGGEGGEMGRAGWRCRLQGARPGAAVVCACSLGTLGSHAARSSLRLTSAARPHQGTLGQKRTLALSSM
jgi:hypothetical protein